MSNTPPVKPGRRKSVLRQAEDIVGCAGIAGLRAADLHIVSGRTLRELTAGMEPEPMAAPPAGPAFNELWSHAAQTPATSSTEP